MSHESSFTSTEVKHAAVEVFVPTFITMILAAIAVVGRLMSRKLQGLPFNASDILVVVSLVGACGASICVLVGKQSIDSNRETTFSSLT